ncbi:Uncharacterised protein [Bacteroides thetaiotaomicron]|nr:Uncharacterised protein [Bacteroides thetaiotaomicron]
MFNERVKELGRKIKLSQRLKLSAGKVKSEKRGYMRNGK